MATWKAQEHICDIVLCKLKEYIISNSICCTVGNVLYIPGTHQAVSQVLHTHIILGSPHHEGGILTSTLPVMKASWLLNCTVGI